MTIAELITHLQGYNPESVIAYDLWQVDDVIGYAEQTGLTITKGQAEQVLDRMDDEKDANIGMSWDVLDYHLQRVMELYQP